MSPDEIISALNDALVSAEILLDNLDEMQDEDSDENNASNIEECRLSIENAQSSAAGLVP